LPPFLVGKGGNRFEKKLQRKTKREGLTRKKRNHKTNFINELNFLKMKKKILSGIVLFAIAAVAAWNVNLNSQSDDLSGISLANVEALADDESASGNTVTCYSSSDAKKGSTYYDCGSCTKQFNSKGTGSSSSCTT
jgi:hypothetical protein